MDPEPPSHVVWVYLVKMGEERLKWKGKDLTEKGKLIRSHPNISELEPVRLAIDELLELCYSVDSHKEYTKFNIAFDNVVSKCKLYQQLWYGTAPFPPKTELHSFHLSQQDDSTG